MSNINFKNNLPLNLKPGQSAILNVDNAFAAQVGPDGEELINGFYVTNKEVGKIEKITDKEGLCVKYTQLEIGQNAILFHAYNPAHSSVFNIIHAPIHDHSDMTTGGPGYATYYSEIEKNEQQEQ